MNIDPNHLFGDMFPEERIVQANEANGIWIFPNHESRLGTSEALYIGGLWYHWGNFISFGEQHGMPGYYIMPSKPLIKDITRLMGMKFLGKSDPFAKQLAHDINQINGRTTIYALSQGCLVTVNAIRQYSMSNAHDFVFFSPAVSYITARRFIPKDRLHYYIPWNDAASIWAPSCNPLKFLSGLVDLARLCHNHRIRGLDFHWEQFHGVTDSSAS